MVNSRYPRFSATGFRSGREALYVLPAHLLPKLRCHFAEFLREGSLKRLGIFSPPTCVGLRYGHHSSSCRNFSWKSGITEFVAPRGPPHLLLGSCTPVCPTWGPRGAPYRLEPNNPRFGSATLLRPSCIHQMPWWCWNINQLSIAYAFRPRLRDRLTLGRLTLPRNPWAYGDRVSHSVSRYSSLHSLLSALHRSSPYGFTAQAMLAYHCGFPQSAASVLRLSPVIFSARVHLTSELLRFL